VFLLFIRKLGNLFTSFFQASEQDTFSQLNL